MKRTPRIILDELIKRAEVRRMFSDNNFGAHRDNDRGAKVRSELVGKMVEGLSSPDRKILKELTSEEIEKLFFTEMWVRRPKEPTQRVRGPVILKK